jgi:hypothetical protein
MFARQLCQKRLEENADDGRHRDRKAVGLRSAAETKLLRAASELLRYEIERVDVDRAAHNALPQHDQRHQPERRHESVDGSERQEHDIDELQNGRRYTTVLKQRIDINTIYV